MAVKFAQTDLPRGLRGGSDTWDQSQASTILNDDWFESVAGSAQNLTPARIDNAQAFYPATVSLAGGPTQNLTPPLYENTPDFFAPSVLRGGVALSPPLYGNVQAFYAATVVRGAVAVSASRLDNAQTFYGLTISQGGPSQTLLPARLDNAQTFYSHTVAALAPVMLPPLLTNTQTFYVGQVNLRISSTPSPDFNTNQFFALIVARGAVTLQPARFDNSQFFYPPLVGDGPPPSDGRGVSGSMLVNMGTMMNR